MSESHNDSHPAHARSAPVAAPVSPLPEVVDDATTRALSDALRSSFAIIRVIMIALVVLFLASGVVTVGPQEKAVVLRFGKPKGGDEQRLLGPGLHWAWPYPIDEVVKIPVGQVQAVGSSVGWYATSAAQEAAGAEPQPGPSLNPATDGYLLTGDGNIIHVRGTLRYRITEPGLRYSFNFEFASNAVQNAFNNALIYAAARFKVDDALTRDIAGFRETARTRLEQLVAQQQLGITVDQIDNVRIIPPRKLKENFEAVLAAEVRSSKEINDARSYENQTLSKARSQAAARVNAGENDRNRLVEFVAAEARRFTDLLPAYNSNPELFIRQHQTEALQRTLANAQEKFVLPDRVNGKPLELRLQVNREPQKQKTAEQPAETDKH